MNVFTLLMLPLFFHEAFAVKHSLRYFLIASSGTQDLPDFAAFATFADVQLGYCESSGRLKHVQELARRFSEDNPQQFQKYVKECEHYKYIFNHHIDDLKKLMGLSEGVHIFQGIESCEWDDETGKIAGFCQFRVDGEDFVSFDAVRKKWIAAKPQALSVKYTLDRNLNLCESHSVFLIHLCLERLKQFLVYWKRFKENTAGPSVSLLQRTPSSPVSCHVTGFYPDNAEMFWRRDGQEVHEDVQYWEILPNHDHTFQMTVELNISLIKTEDWRRYECVFHLSGVKEEIVTRLDRANIITNWVPPSEFPVVTVVAVVVPGLLLLALCISGLYCWRRKYSGFQSANSSDPSANQTFSDATDQQMTRVTYKSAAQAEYNEESSS